MQRFRRAAPIIAVAAFALAVRVLVVFHGGGLYGLGDYDDGVHYSAAVGLINGRLPYRDFLFLQPPGIVLALSPFALLGVGIGDPNGFAAARFCWMGLGALNAALVTTILKPVGAVGALVGGVFYAIYYPAVYGEHTTQLEGLATTSMLIGALFLTRARGASKLNLLIAGAALGASAGVKIWGVAILVAFVVWVARTRGIRGCRWLLVGALAGVSVVCLPFFVAAPARMWQMVVLDQLGRSRNSDIGGRIADLVGQGSVRHFSGPTATALLVTALACIAVLAVFALGHSRGRFGLTWLLVSALVLVSTPSWYSHYASLAAAPLAIVLGAGAGRAETALSRHSPPLRSALVVALALALASYGLPLLAATPGARFPAAALRSAATAVPGCVTADDPSTLVELDVLSRNLSRGCRLEVDLSGLSYDLRPAKPISRRRDRVWQQAVLSYLQSGDLTLISRFQARYYFSPASRSTVKRWPVVVKVGRFALRDPHRRLSATG